MPVGSFLPIMKMASLSVFLIFFLNQQAPISYLRASVKNNKGPLKYNLKFSRAG